MLFQSEPMADLFFLFFFVTGGLRTALTDSSNRGFRPIWVKEEHSMYLTAPNSWANYGSVIGWWIVFTCNPCSYVMGCCFFPFNLDSVSESSRRSNFVPIMRKGVFGQWYLTGKLRIVILCRYFLGTNSFWHDQNWPD